MSELEHQRITPRTIAIPLRNVPKRLIQRRSRLNDEQAVRETNTFEGAIQAGDAGLVGMDGSGNDPEFSQNLGSVALGNVETEETMAGEQQ